MRVRILEAQKTPMPTINRPEWLPKVAELDSASSLVYSQMLPTPQYNWPLLSERLGAEVWVKHENHTPIGAFKVRGGFVYMASLVEKSNSVPGIVTATRGNHGQSIPYAARRYGIPVTIVMPNGNSADKNRAMLALGVELIEHGEDFQASREYAILLGEKRGLHLVPPFHKDLVRGVATYGLELFRAVPNLDTVYVPIGMGSGICGVIAAREATGVQTEIVGVVSDYAPAYALSFEQGTVIEHPVTTRIADGMACRSPDVTALEAIRYGVSRVVRVTDAEVRQAMRTIFDDTHNIAEGAGAAGFAAMVQEKDRNSGKHVAFILCGGNVDRDIFADILSEREARA